MMSADRAMVSYREFVGQLRELAESQSTGTLFFSTDDDHAAIFAMDDGRIVGLRYKRFKGTDALNAFLSVQNGRYRFVSQNTATTHIAGVLPATSELLTILETQYESRDSTEVKSGAESVFNSPEVPAILPPHLRDIIKQEATEYLGPMATIVCDEIFDELDPTTPVDLTDIVGRVAVEIRDVEQEKALKKQTLLRLNAASP